jgi:hypothetical protein
MLLEYINNVIGPGAKKLDRPLTKKYRGRKLKPKEFIQKKRVKTKTTKKKNNKVICQK